MAEEQVIVTPQRCGDLGGGDEFSDEGLGATELLGCTQGINIIKLRASWDGSKVIQVVSVAFLDSGRELPLWLRSKAKLVWEVNIVLINAFLGVLGHVRETHCLNPVSDSGEASLKRLQQGILRCGDMIAEVIGEEIQAVLAIN